MGTEPEYREPGRADERQLVVCPTCQRQVATSGESAVCTACDTRFATSEAATVIEHNAVRALVHSLEAPPMARGMTSGQRIAVSAAVVIGAVIGTLAFGSIGALVSFGAVAGLLVAAKVKTGGRLYG